MAVSVHLSTAANTSLSSANSRNSNRVLAKAAQSSGARSFNSDAVTLNLSPQQQARERSSSRALRNLSDASSFVSVAQEASVEIKRLLTHSKTLTQTIENTVDPVRRAALAEEAVAAVNEIDNVIRAATTTNSNSVVNYGAQSYSFSLNGGDSSSQSSGSVFISNIRASRSDLGLDQLSSASFSENPSAAIETLDEATSRLSFVQSNLRNTEKEISFIAEKFGLRASDTSAQSGSAAADAAALAEKISQLVSATTAEVSSGLDAKRVQALIATPSTPSKPVSGSSD